jgi:DNA-binding GntR family transcriptional regulator
VSTSPPTLVGRLPRTADAIAAAELRGAIVRGDLRPGEKIHQQDTAAALGVSLIPLREALKTLAGEGIVTYEPQRGYFVTDLPVERIRELELARETLEGEVERLAIARVGDEAIAAMRLHLRNQERAVAERDPVEMIAANRAFHFTIFELCENAWLVRFVSQLWDAIDPYRVLSYRRMWMQLEEELLPEEILAEHRGIVEALEEMDNESALELLREHRRRSQEFLVVLGLPLDGQP